MPQFQREEGAVRIKVRVLIVIGSPMQNSIFDPNTGTDLLINNKSQSFLFLTREIFVQSSTKDFLFAAHTICSKQTQIFLNVFHLYLLVPFHLRLLFYFFSCLLYLQAIVKVYFSKSSGYADITLKNLDGILLHHRNISGNYFYPNLGLTSEG